MESHGFIALGGVKGEGVGFTDALTDLLTYRDGGRVTRMASLSVLHCIGITYVLHSVSVVIHFTSSYNVTGQKVVY